MDALKEISSLHFGVKIMSAKNIEITDSKGHLFVRCYLSAGNNQRVRLESHEVSPYVDISWNAPFSLDFMYTQSMDTINRGTFVFEIRCRSSRTPLLQKIIGGIGHVCGSKLIGRGEVTWRSIFESPDMGSETWVVMRSKKSSIKEPSIFVSMKIKVPMVVVTKESKMKEVGKLKNKWDERCGCSHSHCCETSCMDSELVALGFSLDAF